MAEFSMTNTRGAFDEEDTCIPNFHIKPLLDREKTEAAGRPIYDDVEFVEIIIPGNDRERPVQRVAQDHVDRWPEQYKRFKDNKSQRIEEGYPLIEWPQISRGLAATLAHDHILTVEQLSKVADTNLQSIGPGLLDLKYKAAKFIEVMGSESKFNKITDENLKLQKQVKALTKKVDQLGDKLDEVTTASVKAQKPPVAKPGKG